jgi:hypothetical protein
MIEDREKAIELGVPIHSNLLITKPKYINKYLLL